MFPLYRRFTVRHDTDMAYTTAATAMAANALQASNRPHTKMLSFGCRMALALALAAWTFRFAAYTRHLQIHDNAAVSVVAKQSAAHVQATNNAFRAFARFRRSFQPLIHALARVQARFRTGVAVRNACRLRARILARPARHEPERRRASAAMSSAVDGFALHRQPNVPFQGVAMMAPPMA